MSETGKTIALIEALKGSGGGGGSGSNKFIVTLIPTSEDYSGTMDKTVAEINAAYEAGQQIVYRVLINESSYMDVACTVPYYVDGYTYPSFDAFIVSTDINAILYAFTGSTNDGTEYTYGCVAYPLTPAS